jgi:molybdate transport system substrate-binding protein
MRHLWTSLLLSILVLIACSPVTPQPPAVVPVQAGTLTIYAAASLNDAFNEIGAVFSATNPGFMIVYNFAGSQQLAQQIVEGAPADVFASANNTQMNVAIESGRILTGTQRIFTRNRLVVVTPADNPAGISTLQDLSKPGLKLVFAAAEVPVGQYSLDFLDKAEADGSLGAGYKDAVLANVVSYEENVRAVLTKVTLGEADAGIVYTSDSTRDAGEQVQRIDIPDTLNTVASYPIAPLADSPRIALAEAFIDYVLSAEGQERLAKYGFLAVEE